MTTDNRDEEVIFNVARKLPDDARAIYLQQVCREDSALHRRVEILLDADGLRDFLDSRQNVAEVTLDRPITEGPGTIVGRYKLLQKVGEGGFGVVFMAEQQEPVIRKVAIKVIKPGMDTSSVVARFEAERQALALMDHPNISRVFDAGTTVHGRPYFVMESHSRFTSIEVLRREPIAPFANESRSSCRSVTPCSMLTRRASSIGTSNRPTYWSHNTTACPCPRSSISAWRRRSTSSSQTRRYTLPSIKRLERFRT